MDFDWLWKGLVTDWLTLILTSIGAGVVAWLRKRGSTWVNPILYGLGSAALILVISILIQHLFARSQSVDVSPTGLEANIKSWANEYHFSFRKEPDPKSFFRLVIETIPRRYIIVSQDKEHHHGFILFVARVVPDPEHQKAFEKLPESNRVQLISDIKVNLANQNLGYNIIGPLKVIEIEHSVPIPELTQSSFLMHVKYTERGIIVVTERIISFLAAQSAK